MLAKAQLYGSMGLVTQAEAALTEAESLLDNMPADSARPWRVHHWLLARLLQLWKGDTLAMQQTGALMLLVSPRWNRVHTAKCHTEQPASCPAELSMRCLPESCYSRSIAQQPFQHQCYS